MKEVRLITDEFISKYEGIRPPMTPIGEFVYYRTYSRFLEGEKRRETWGETIRRAVEYNVGLEIKHLRKQGKYITKNVVKSLRAEAEAIYDNLFNLRQFTSGRTLWVGGTDVAERFPLSNFNCAFKVIRGNNFDSFGQLFYLLMVGTGVGFRTLPEDIAELPEYRTNIELINKPYAPKIKADRNDLTELEIIDDIALIHVGDSKEGWVESLNMYFNIITSHIYRGINSIIINYDNVRPKGERLKTFGGTASGHESLKNMFTKIHRVMNEAKGQLRTIDAMDICNIIGANVVVGGVRRTSELNLSRKEDTLIANSKNDLYMQEGDKWVLNPKTGHRRMSNNSIYYDRKPTRAELHEDFINLKLTGERGFINVVEARRRNKYFNGINPCAEILLDDEQTCNLTTNNCMAFVKNGALDRKALFNAFTLSARIGLRMTLVDLEIKSWDKKQKRDRLIGVSLTGWQDMVEAVGLTREQQKNLLKELRFTVRREANDYAKELGINQPLLTTTVKPEGTLSLLPTVSSGLHNSHSPYYMRRVRINSHDALCKVAESLGWIVDIENGETAENCTTKVITFPVKSPAKRTKYDVSAIEQLETYKMFMNDYVEHNASITVTVKESEWEDVEKWVYDNWDCVVGISFLALMDNFYPLLPYESIDEETYNKMVSEMKEFKPELISDYETGEDFDIGTEGCEGGFCPVR